MRRYLPIILSVIVILAIGAAAFVMSDKKGDAPVSVASVTADTTTPDQPADGRSPQLKGIGVVDVVALLRQSDAALSIEKQLNTKRKTYQDDLVAEEKKLRAMEEELVKDTKKGSPEFNEKRKKFETAVRALQKNAQQKRISLDRAAGKAVNELQGKITEITAEIANAKNLQMVLTRDQVVIVSKPLDITQDVMEKLNQQLTSVAIKIEDAKAPTEAK